MYWRGTSRSKPKEKLCFSKLSYFCLVWKEGNLSIFILRERRTLSVLSVSMCVPWGISHGGHTAGWWVPWWERLQTAPQGCRARRQHGPTLWRRFENIFQTVRGKSVKDLTTQYNREPDLHCRSSWGHHLCGGTAHTSVDSKGVRGKSGWVWHNRYFPVSHGTWKDLLCLAVCRCTHHTCRPLLWLTLSAKPWTCGHLDNAVAS